MTTAAPIEARPPRERPAQHRPVRRALVGGAIGALIGINAPYVLLGLLPMIIHWRWPPQWMPDPLAVLKAPLSPRYSEGWIVSVIPLAVAALALLLPGRWRIAAVAIAIFFYMLIGISLLID